MKGIIKELMIKFIHTLVSIYRITRFYKPFKIPEKVSGEKCVILMHGASLKPLLKNNMDFFLDKVKICVNNMVFEEHYEIIKPEYYVLADPIYFLKNTTEERKKNRESLFDNIVQKTTWKMKLFIPYHKDTEYNLFDRFKKNKNVEICFYYGIPVKGFKKFIFTCYKYNIGVPIFQNVLIACIYLAINMKFKEINIFGADHSWFKDMVVDENNMLCLKDNHFYDEGVVKIKPFYKDLYCSVTWRMDEIMYIFSLMFKQYHLLNEFAKQENVKIYNFTETSFIDAFERKSLT